MNKKKPLVSVIMPTYGRPDKILNAINSVLMQSYSNIELIIVDDNGKHSINQKLTQDLIQENFSDNNKVKYIYLDSNVGGGLARNVGIDSAKGDYITFLDDDDTYLQGKILIQLKEFLQNESLDAVCVAANVKDQFGNLIRVSSPEGKTKKEFVLHGNIMTPMLMIKRSFLIKTGVKFLDIPRYQDHSLFLIMLKYNVCYSFINYIGYNHIIHNGDRISYSSASSQAIPIIFNLENSILDINELTRKESGLLELRRDLLMLEFQVFSDKKKRYKLFVKSIFVLFRSINTRYFNNSISIFVKCLLGPNAHGRIKKIISLGVK